MMSSAYLATGAVIESKNSVCAIKLVQTIRTQMGTREFVPDHP